MPAKLPRFVENLVLRKKSMERINKTFEKYNFVYFSNGVGILHIAFIYSYLHP